MPSPKMLAALASGVALIATPGAARAQTSPATPPTRGDQQPRSEAIGFDMGPPVTPDLVARVMAGVTSRVPGPFEPNWESLKSNYRVPDWFRDAKFGLYIHWGLYSVPAYHNEWYQKYMYGNPGIREWHIKNYGPLDKSGYIKFADRFATHFEPDKWAELFEKAGVKYIVPTVEHHDWFSLWDSAVSPWNAKKIGPKRDLVGELSAAVRKRGIRFGVANHSVEHYTFIRDKPPIGMASDLEDPALADFYWVKHDDANLQRFLRLWIEKNVELIDKYKPDLLWFDNGINHRYYDPLKLHVAAYYYNRARQWNKDVSMVTKHDAFLEGTIKDYERQGRAPKQLTEYIWQPDDPIGPTFGYTTIDRGHGDRAIDMVVGGPDIYIRRLVQNVSRNGNYGLNISPRGDGTIPENQQEVLLEMGKWLRANGEAIYATRPWTRSEEGNVFFTTRGDTFYAISLEWPKEPLLLKSLANGMVGGKVAKVELLGHRGKLEFEQNAEGLRITPPTEKANAFAHAFKISGLKLK